MAPAPASLAHLYRATTIVGSQCVCSVLVQQYCPTALIGNLAAYIMSMVISDVNYI